MLPPTDSADAIERALAVARASGQRIAAASATRSHLVAPPSPAASPAIAAAQATPVRAPRSGAPRLDGCTHIDRRPDEGPLLVDTFRQVEHARPGYVGLVREYGHGLVDATLLDVDQDDLRRLSGRGRAKCGKRVAPSEGSCRSDSSARRAKSELRRRICDVGADHLLTLTKRGKFETRADAWGAWAKLARKLEPLLGRHVAVIEPHACEGFHVHVAVRGYKSQGVVRRAWYRVLGGRGDEKDGDAPGNIDLVYWRRGGARTLGRYMGKYLGKMAFNVPFGKKAFACSHGVCSGRVRRLYLPAYLSGDAATVFHQWLARQYQRAFCCSRRWSYGGATGVSFYSDG